MRILLGTHHLEIRAGSELFNAELAHALRARGNDVALFTFFKGELAAQIEAHGIPVFDPDDTSVIARFMPEIIQTCHSPCAHFLRSIVPDVTRVHAMLGVIPPLEAPPLDAGVFSLGLAVSEEVVDQVKRASFGRDVEVAVFRNWFDDAAVVATRAAVLHWPRRVAVISNHIAPELIDALTVLEAAGDVLVDYFGIQRKSVVVDGVLLGQYDLIISIGRTSLLAAACGIPCIMADIHGSDGLLTVDNLNLVRNCNFSGRLTRQAITSAHLKEEIEKIGSCDLPQLRNRVTTEYSLRARVDWLLLRYEVLLADQRDAATYSRKLTTFSAPGEGLVHAEITSEVRKLREQLATAQRQIDARQSIRGSIKSIYAETRNLGQLFQKSIRSIFH
jgi:hypothetical protein